MKKVFIAGLMLVSVAFADFERVNNHVIDHETNLMWSDDESSRGTANIDGAVKMCELMELDGYDDWRLPNINELYSIVDCSKLSPAIDVAFQNVVYRSDWDYYYWSSTALAGTDAAWKVGYNYGYVSWYRKFVSYYVRCVRGGQP